MTSLATIFASEVTISSMTNYLSGNLSMCVVYWINTMIIHHEHYRWLFIEPFRGKNSSRFDDI